MASWTEYVLFTLNWPRIIPSWSLSSSLLDAEREKITIFTYILVIGCTTVRGGGKGHRSGGDWWPPWLECLAHQTWSSFLLFSFFAYQLRPFYYPSWPTRHDLVSSFFYLFYHFLPSRDIIQFPPFLIFLSLFLSFLLLFMIFPCPPAMIQF